MADNVVFPRKLLKKFITLYKELPCLWDRNCPAYKIKMKRHDAVSKLTELVQEYDPSATRVHVLRKIESLRACVRREFKRVQDSRHRATTDDEIYTPHLWYYTMLSFIFREDDNNYKSKNPASSPEQNSNSEEEDEDGTSHAFEQSMDSYTAEYNVPAMVEVSDNSPPPKRLTTYDDDKKRHCTEIEDEYDAIGINVAAKLRNLPANMRICAEKLINDVLYQAQMNGLNSSTVISTPDPFKQVVL